MMTGNLLPSPIDIAPIKEKEIPPEPHICPLLPGNSAPLHFYGNTVIHAVYCSPKHPYVAHGYNVSVCACLNE